MLPHGEPYIGVIADTHGLLRPQALQAMAGAELIIHAGDIGKPEILQALQTVAPVVAVRGNNDTGAWAMDLPLTTTVSVRQRHLYILHDLHDLAVDPVAAGFAAVICGHSHRPKLEQHGGVLFLNPGSAGPRRFQLPIAIARLYLRDQTVDAEIIELTA